MTDLLVRALPKEDAVLIAAQAAKRGISQAEYVRQIIHEAVRRERRPLRELAGGFDGMWPEMWTHLAELDAEWDE